MSTKTMEGYTAEFEAWAENVDPAELEEVDTSSLRALVEIADRGRAVERDLPPAVAKARADGWSWAVIGEMLGVSKQAAQQRYGRAAAKREAAAAES